MAGVQELELVPLDASERACTVGGSPFAVQLPYQPQREREAERLIAKAAQGRAMQRLRGPVLAQDCELAESAREWLAGLPEAVRPRQLAARYPRIANRISTLWRRPVQMDKYFEDLLIDQRGDRQGFPLAVASELNALKEYYCSQVFPVKPTIWDDQYMSNARSR